VCEQEACVHDIEPLVVRRRPQDVVDTKLHVVDPGLRSLVPGELDLRRIEVGADDEPIRHDLSELTGDVSATTTKVETAGGGRDSESGEQGAGCRPHHAGEHPEPLPALQAPADHVRRRAHAAPRGRDRATVPFGLAIGAVRVPLRRGGPRGSARVSADGGGVDRGPEVFDHRRRCRRDGLALGEEDSRHTALRV
jgi:hypothetical protein